MDSLPTFSLLCLSAVVVCTMLVVVIRFDVEARMERRRFEARVRRGAARLIHEAERARAPQRH